MKLSLYTGAVLNNLWRSWVSGERTDLRSRQAIPRSCESISFAQPTGIGETNRCSMGTISRKVVLTDGDTQESGAQGSP
jgi:hypothetical protein